MRSRLWKPRLTASLETAIGLAFAMLFALVLASAASAEDPPQASKGLKPDTDVIPGRYIVVYEDSVDGVAQETAQRERALGFERRFLYRSALQGFSAKLSPGQVRKLEADPAVDFVSEDRRLEASASVPLAPGEPTPPTGIRRVKAATTTTVRQQSGTNVAVLDTGIDLSHPDLNAASGTNCISPGSPPTDDDGHGTHVAGTIAAKNNGAGVVGVAPNTKVYAVKVLGSTGGSTATVTCGIDWVTANKNTHNIKVANMSLGGSGDTVASCATTTDPMHKAICNSTAAGVNYVVAAGNDAWEFDLWPPDVPAAYPQVLTVTAAADSDGSPGGSGGYTCDFEYDDEYASFSNFAGTSAGEAHTIAAPGACINSTWPGGGYNAISGTSMASPHMAGVVALCVNEAGTPGACASRTPAQVITHMRSDAQTYNQANPSYGFYGDPLHSPVSGFYYGYLTRTLPPAAQAAPPTNTSLPAISGTARDGETLSASTGSWTGTQPISYSYQWRRCDSNGDSCSNISGATGSSYRLVSADVNRRLRVVVTARNSAGASSATSNASAIVAAAPPTIGSLPSITGKAQKGARLWASPGTWTGTQPISYSYQWRRCKSAGGSCKKIPGATYRKYRVTKKDVGRRLRVQVTAKNAGGSRLAISAATKIVTK